VRPGRDADPSPPSSAEDKNRVLSLRAFVAYDRVKPKLNSKKASYSSAQNLSYSFCYIKTKDCNTVFSRVICALFFSTLAAEKLGCVK
jgi:hypothetical protein